MDNKTFITALKTAVREVIKEELTEILREGLQSTINEMTKPTKPVMKTASKPVVKTNNNSNRNVTFSENKWASVLNSTDPLIESNPAGFKEMLQEGMDELRFSSDDAHGFGMLRQPMNQGQTVMEDPETGKVYDVAPEVEKAMTRDYSALMKAIADKKK
jgi:ribosomal protein S20